MECAICQHRTKRVFDIGTYRIIECLNCNHRMVDTDGVAIDIKSIYSDDYFFGGREGYPNYLEEGKVRVNQGRDYGKILARYIESPGSILDVGAAAGFILKGLTESGWEGYGVELNEHMAHYARNELRLNVHTGALESFDPGRRFDVVCFIQVIGSFVNPKEALEITSRMLSENGYILIETWNYRSWTARLFGKRWHEYSPPIALHWFSPRSLNDLMEKHGFGLIGFGRVPKKLTAGYAKSIISHKLNWLPCAFLMQSLLDIIPKNLPIPYLADDLFWGLYKRQSC